MDEKKLEVMKMVVNGEKLEAEPYIRTTHPTQTRSKYFGEELQCSSIPQLKLISRLNPSITEGFRKDNKGFVYNKDTKSRNFRRQKNSSSFQKSAIRLRQRTVNSKTYWVTIFQWVIVFMQQKYREPAQSLQLI